MKKTCAVLIAVLTLFALLCPITALAEQTGKTENIHLISPSAVAFSDGFLFVADNITESQSVVHVFDVSGESPQLKSTIDFDNHIFRLRAFNDSLYALSSDCYFVVDITSQSLAPQRVNVVIRDLAVVGSDTYFLKSNGIYKNDNPNPTIDNNSESEIKALVVLDTNLVILFGATIRVFDTQDPQTTLPEAVNGSTVYTGGIKLSNKSAFFNSTSLFCDGKVILEKSEYDFLDIAVENETLFVLNSNNQVFKYVLDEAAYKPDAGFSIGSDKVTIAPPKLDDITSYTLVYSKGYPSNIVYLANSIENQPSIPDLVPQTNDTMFLVLGYKDDNLHDYYYVFYNGNFGWVKKSITSKQTVKDDSKLEVVNTNVSDISVVKARLMSPSAVYVYYLPYAEPTEKGEKHRFTQSVESLTEVVLLQHFENQGQNWYLISYENNTRFGFVKKGDVGQLSSTSLLSQQQLVSRQKINATLSDNVNVFVTKELLDDQKTVDPESNEILTLKSGMIVNVLEQTDSASFLQIVYPDGRKFYGWVANQFLIDIHALTTNTAVGLILISSAVACVVVVLVVLAVLKRKKVASLN